MDAFCSGMSSLFRLSAFSVVLIITGTAVVVSILVVSIVVIVDVVDGLLVVLLPLLFIAVVGIVITVVLVTVLLVLLEIDVVVDGISGTKCNNGGAGLGRKPMHLLHILPPLDESPSPRKISVNN